MQAGSRILLLLLQSSQYKIAIMAPYQSWDTPPKENNSTAPQTMHTPSPFIVAIKRLWRPVLLTIVIIGALLLGFMLVRYIVEKTRKPQETVTATSGKIIGDFPAELVLEPSAVAKESYSVHYNTQGVSQPVLSYVSKKTIPENVAIFRNYFVVNNWTILHNANPLDRFTYFYAMRNNYKNEANVTMEQVGNQVQITISYVAR